MTSGLSILLHDVILLPDVTSCDKVNIMFIILQSFQSYLDAAQTKGFNPETHTGHWRQLALRTSRLGHVMALVDFHPQTLTEVSTFQGFLIDFPVLFKAF